MAKRKPAKLDGSLIKKKLFGYFLINADIQNAICLYCCKFALILRTIKRGNILPIAPNIGTRFYCSFSLRCYNPHTNFIGL